MARPHLRTKEDGRYYIDHVTTEGRKRFALTEGGKPVRDLATAKRKLAHYIQRWEQSQQIEEAARILKDPTVAECFDYYTDEYCKARGRANATVAKARELRADLLDFLRRERIGRVSQLQPRVVERYIAALRDRGLSEKTLHGKIATLRAVLYAARRAGMIATSPITEWVRVRPADVEKHILEPADLVVISSIMAEHAPWLAGPVQWIIETGNRPSDACDLRFRQVDTTRRIVSRVSVKVKELKTYPITRGAAAIIEEAALRAHAPGDHVFLAPGGKPFTPDTLLVQFKRALKRGGFHRPETKLKDLRDAFGTLMANDCACPLPIVRVLMGHTRIETTMKYVRPREADPFLQNYEAIRAKLSRAVTNGKNIE